MTQTIERRYPAPADEIWRLWTTRGGIERWWAPEGFTVELERLDLREGGELVYVMTATAPAQVAFMESAGMPLRTESRKTFTEVVPNERLGYDSLVDFVPGVEPYEARTVVELSPDGDGTIVTMTMDDLHDEVWTERLVAGRANELDNLGALIAGR